MTLKDWFETRKEEQQAARPVDPRIDDNIGKLWVKCFNCNAQLPRKELEQQMMVCPQCGYHFRVNARTRIKQLFDENTFEELYANIKPSDPLDFFDTESYKSRQVSAQKKTNLNDAVITGIGKVNGIEIACAIMDFEYMGGSMGSVVGEKVTKIIEEALIKKIPVITITASGGARMQESALSLMQMAKTSCAVAKLNEAKLLYINILTDPTFGGVTASFGTIGDIIIAEQGARIGFAGRRVIEQTIRQKLPADFQTAEYLMKHGQLDMITKRSDLKDTLTKILKLHKCK
jgi:acetyl-CoA carboxylase carboxyl transferase subunit beta